MTISPWKRVIALSATALFAGVAASVAIAAPREATRPLASGIHPNVSADTEQVLSEGGTASAYYIANLMDIVGTPILCPGTSFDRDCAAESSIPVKAPTNPQYLYAAVGTGAAQLDFVSQKSGSGSSPKTSQTPAPVFADAKDAYSNVSPIGFVTGWSGASPSAVAEDTIHFAAGDAPIPLGPAESGSYVPSGFTAYTDSLSAYNANGDLTGGSFNANRGPAVVEPDLATGLSVIYNISGGLPSSINLSQDSLCAIFTGVYTNWSQVPESGGVSEPITLVHRSDSSGSTFIFSYDLSKMCSSSNPFHGTGAPLDIHYWGSPNNTLTQGVGTDSNNFLSGNVIPTDGSAPEVVWPSTSVGAAKTSGMLAAVEATAGAIGYVSPAYATNGSLSEMNVENYEGGFEPATATTIAASMSTFTSSGSAPPAYPQATKSAALYFPFPTSATGDALVGFSYAYFYQCTKKADADQVSAIKKLFEYETEAKTAPIAATVAAFWNFNALPSAELKLLQTAVSGLKDAPVTKGTYINPATGVKSNYSCTAT